MCFVFLYMFDLLKYLFRQKQGGEKKERYNIEGEV